MIVSYRWLSSQEQAIEGLAAVEQTEEQEVKDHVKEQWVARIIARRTALGMANEPISTHQQRRGWSQPPCELCVWLILFFAFI